MFHQKTSELQQNMPPIPSEKWIKAGHAITALAKCLPETALVGGFALRLHLKKRDLLIPDMPALDIDFMTTQETFDKVRNIFKLPKEDFVLKGKSLPKNIEDLIYVSFRRKGSKEPKPVIMGGGCDNFMESPWNYMALEDKQYKQHIDLFASDENNETQMINLEGTPVTVITPEELFFKRFMQLKKTINGIKTKDDLLINLPRKNYQYYYLTGSLVNPKKMADIWKKKTGNEDWGKSIAEFTQNLETRITDGAIKLVDKYH